MADPRLRLSLDVSAVPDRPVGAGQYTVQLAAALSHSAELDLVLFSRRDDGPRWRAVAAEAGIVAAAPGPRPLRLAWEQVRLPGLLAGQPCGGPPRSALHHARALVGARRW